MAMRKLTVNCKRSLAWYGVVLMIMVDGTLVGSVRLGCSTTITIDENSHIVYCCRDILNDDGHSSRNISDVINIPTGENDVNLVARLGWVTLRLEQIED